MRRYLVIQLARFGDILQSKRLMLSLWREAGEREIHLALDGSLVPLARLVYPFAVLHPLSAHALGPAACAQDILRQNLPALARLSEQVFDKVYNLNYSGLSLALSRLFDPDCVVGYRERAGQLLIDSWPALIFRLTRQRRQAGLNLADFWAGFAEKICEPATVNPEAAPGGRGLGVVLSGREARRSLPAPVLAGIVQAAYARLGRGKIYLFGTKAEHRFALELKRLLNPACLDKLVDLSGKTDYPGLAEALPGLDRLLTPDTGIMHLGAHLGVPVTGFFLSSAWCFETGPYGAGHEVWQALEPCAPCLESAPCAYGLNCLNPFMGRDFLRVLTNPKAAPLAGLSRFLGVFDVLGQDFKAASGEEPGAAWRGRLRAFLAKRQRLADLTPDLELAAKFEPESVWMLDPEAADGERLRRESD